MSELVASYAACECSAETLGQKPRATTDSYRIDELDGLDDVKAQIFPGTFTIQVSRSWWRGLSDVQRRAVLAHELAHDEDPEACEECVDMRAGARLRWEGISARAAVDAFAAVVGRRRTRDTVLHGWMSADAVIRQRGGTGHIPGHAALSTQIAGVPTAEPERSGGTLKLDQTSTVGGIEDEELGKSIGVPGVDFPADPPKPPKAPGDGAGEVLSVGALLAAAGVVVLVIALSRR